MDKLKYIRIQDQEGTYGEKIPLEVDSASVTMTNGNSLQDNLVQIRAEVDEKVDKETGKGLSTNDYTDAEKTKLNGIQRNANYTQIDSTLSKRSYAADAKAVGDALVQMRSNISSPPLMAATAAEMVNTKKIYVYTGNETGYNHGYWYYYDNSQWKPGGIYSAVNNAVDDLTERTQVAEDKAEDAQSRLTPLEGRMTTAEGDIDSLETKSFTFVEDGYVQNGIAYFTNNNQVLFEITGIGGGGGGGDDPEQSEYWSTKSKNWAVGLTGGGNPSDTNNSKYWSSQSASYAHGGTNTRTGEDTDNAEYFKDKAKEWAIGVTDTTSAPSDTNNAKYWSEQAQTYLNTQGQVWINSLAAKEVELEGELSTHESTLETQLTTAAESYIHGGTGTRAGEDTDNAQYYNNRAKAWAVGLTDSSIPSDTNNAKYWADHAADYVDQQGQVWSDLAQSWAVGGTGSRTGQDTNNASYYATQAQTYYNNIQANCVTTFNNRRGTVVPTAGDYIAAMITRGGSTVEADLTAAQTAIATKASQVDLEAVQDSKVDKDAALLDLDTTAVSGLDHDLYAAIVTLGWNTGSANVIVAS